MFSVAAGVPPGVEPGIRTCLVRRKDLALAQTRLFRSRASVWSAATCRRCFPRAQANSLRMRPSREQKRQQVGALQTLLRLPNPHLHSPRVVSAMR